MTLKRVWVHAGMYDDIISFAKDEWKCGKKRASNGKPLYKSFPDSLDAYIEFMKDDMGER